MAKADVNANFNILSNYDLHINAFDGQCTADIVMKRFIEIITNQDYKSVVGILGMSIFKVVNVKNEKGQQLVGRFVLMVRASD